MRKVFVACLTPIYLIIQIVKTTCSLGFCLGSSICDIVINFLEIMEQYWCEKFNFKE